MHGLSIVCAVGLAAVTFSAPAAAAGHAGGGGSAGVGGGGPIPHAQHSNGAVGQNGPSGLGYGPERFASSGNPGAAKSVGRPPPPSMRVEMPGPQPSGDWWLRHERRN
jgi:hypothetical protein